MTTKRFTLLILLIISFNGHAQSKTVPVVIFTAKQAEFVSRLEALGTLRARESVEISSLVTERVASVHFDDGQRVKLGDVLVVMDHSEERAQKTEAQVLVDEAQRQLDRLASLVKTDAATESLLDQRRSELESAKARLHIIDTRINERRIAAPFDGVLGFRNVSVGALVNVGDVITSLDDDSVMKLDFSVPELYLNTLAIGSSIQARSKVFSDRTFTGAISSISARVDPITRAVSLRAMIENTDRALKSGMLMSITIQSQSRRNIEVPEEALFKNSGATYVYVVDAQASSTSVALREVQVGQRENGRVEITGGLLEGEKIVTHGHFRLKPGGAVTISAEQTHIDQNLASLLTKTLLPK